MEQSQKNRLTANFQVLTKNQQIWKSIFKMAGGVEMEPVITISAWLGRLCKHFALYYGWY